MPFADDRQSGQREFSVPAAVARRARVLFEGEAVEIGEVDGRPSARGRSLQRPIPSGRLTSSGDLLVTLGAAAARGAEDRQIDDTDVANASLVAALSDHPVTTEPARFVYSHHLAHSLGEDPDQFSGEYDTLVGPASDAFRARYK